MRQACLLLPLAMLGLSLRVASPQPLTLSREGRTDYTIIVDPDATDAERHAAEELASFLLQVTGAQFPVRESAIVARDPAIIVGPGRALKTLAPDLRVDDLSPDGIVIESRGPNLILAGDRPRGTLYAVYSFLEDAVGIRWWTPTATHLPHLATLTVPEQHVRYVPPLEYRETFWYDAFVDQDWAARNKNNGMRTKLDATRGGCVSYAGNFVHTFAGLVPPGKHFDEHPEWFAFIDGERRTNDDAQRTALCLTNPEMREELLRAVFARLDANPDAMIMSVSQNDNRSYCHCADCTALEEAEGSPAGPLLHLVNYVADRVAERHPEVAVDTLAYQYTRKPPLHVRPRPNEIVRLCSIECSFLQPLSDPINQSFGDDIRGWSRICNRLYVWDYTTNFSHYLLPHPNLRVLGANVRFFVENGVKGVFEQGAYHSYGAEFAPLRSWVLSKLLWNPQLDDQALIEEFVRGYYGPAGPHILAYINRLEDSADAWGGFMHYYNQPDAPFLTLQFMSGAEEDFAAARAAVADDPELLNRVEVAYLPLRYVWAMRWFDLKAQARHEGIDWPGPADYTENARAFMAVAKTNAVTRIAEGRGIETFEARTVGLGRTASPPPPGCEQMGPDECIDLQDNAFRLAREGQWATLTHDGLASDGVAARMGGEHREWAVQQPLAVAGLDPDATYSVYASIRCEKIGDQGLAFSYGVYDTANKQSVGSAQVQCTQVQDDQYHTFQVVTGKLTDQMYVWVAPPQNPDNVKAVWVDRIWLVKAAP